MTSTTEIETCATRNAAPRRERRKPWETASLLSVRLSAVRDASTAGSKPNAMPVAVATAIVKRSAARSMVSAYGVLNTIDFGAVIAGQQNVSPGREQQPDDAPTHGEQHAFEQELSDDAAAAGAQCQADRDLPVPGRIACQQQTSQIGTRDHEQAGDGCGEQLGNPRGTWPSLRMNARQRRERESRTVAALRVGRCQLTRKAAHLGTSLFERPTRFQLTDEIQTRAVAAQHVEVERSDVGHHVRHKDIDRPAGLRPCETCWADADDRERGPIQFEDGTNTSGIRGKSPLPERMAQDDDRVSSGHDILIREKEAAQMRADIEGGEIVR